MIWRGEVSEEKSKQGRVVVYLTVGRERGKSRGYQEEFG
jgi:hypothetical protein